jgi:hypothetical protein
MSARDKFHDVVKLAKSFHELLSKNIKLGY